MITHHLNNPFDAERISEDNFGKIALANLERLKTNNQTGQFTLLIDATQPLYNTYKTSVSAEAFEIALREGKTITVDAAIKGIKHYVSRKEGVIADVFDGKPEVYEQFFPQGLTEYSHASKKNIDMLFKRFADTAADYTVELGVEVAEESLIMYNNYVLLRESQLGAIGEVKELDSDADAARAELAIQLFVNLLTLLITFKDDTQRVKDFFDESMFHKPGEEEEDEAPPEG